ncbi:MAG: dihydrofolate reductase [Chitinophagaceae bacterium]|nr:MAG: dihydrofolate reductase [Chitinophagaceae bacterium]
MRKLIAAINMTLDGFCDHTAVSPGQEIHQHYTDLLRSADTILYGRVTFQLMEYWRNVVKNPTGEPAMDEFAATMDRIPKVVFSHTMKTVDWETARLATKDIQQEVADLKQLPGGDILVGSPGLIATLTNLDLIDEYQLCVHPVVAGGGLVLFKDLQDKFFLKLVNTKIFDEGAVVLYYVRPGKDR